jgi:WhiB family transcriptional regulator, redox-sensing transcriptional regulator
MTVTSLPSAGWQHRAACRSQGDLFFGLDGEPANLRDAREARAKAVCSSCPVRPRCLRLALDTGTVHGVFGGTGEQERADMISAERRAAA